VTVSCIRNEVMICHKSTLLLACKNIVVMLKLGKSRKENKKQTVMNDSSPWWWRQHATLKCRSAQTRLHGAIYQKSVIFILTAVRTWNLTTMMMMIMAMSLNSGHWHVGCWYEFCNMNSRVHRFGRGTKHVKVVGWPVFEITPSRLWTTVGFR
jgi:hypothetical protein